MEETQAAEKTLIDASEVKIKTVDWAQLQANGQVKFYQGEPHGGLERYDLPQFDPRRVAPIAGLDVCLALLLEERSWALAPARKETTAWWVAAAYVRLGYVPPLALVDLFDDQPGLFPDETRKVIAIVKSALAERQERISKISATLTRVQRTLAW